MERGYKYFLIIDLFDPFRPHLNHPNLSLNSNSYLRKRDWGWKNPGESIFHWEDGPLGAKNAHIEEETMSVEPWDFSEFFSFTFVAVGVTFLKGILLLLKKVLISNIQILSLSL